MAHYLPVLIVSVNTVPDDSTVAQRPRNQVDYLSHEWEEEDVWRSWRNMTRQKHEIANGVRLENASWRTWWKQRNKLKTVSPETLNWLKDSDVTWLYGPLHTATDLAPPPKPATHGDSKSTTDNLDLSIPERKPILKHRSISQMLTSDLPSPLFSPTQSDDDNDSDEAYYRRQSRTEASSPPPRRPPLAHTKSDTHFIRWGPNRAFRKDSPPRIKATEPSTSTLTTRRSSSTNLSGFFGECSTGPQQHHYPAHQRSTSPRGSSGNSSLPPQDESAGGTASSSGFANSSSSNNGKKKHISFNTFVEQCIAIDKPHSLPDDYSPTTGGEYDDGYEEDEEDGFDDGSALISDSDSDLMVPEYDDEDEDEDEEEEVLSMAGSRRNPHSSIPSNPPISSSTTTTTSSSSINNRKRSKSKNSTSSSSTTSSSSATSSSRRLPSVHPSRKGRSQSVLSQVRSPMINLRTSSLGDREPLTIAPIAPTLLKAAGTSGAWDSHVHHPHDPSSYFDAVDSSFDQWNERFDDAVSSGPGDEHEAAGVMMMGGGAKKAHRLLDSVELVYVPPLWNGPYLHSEEDEEAADVGDAEHHAAVDSGGGPRIVDAAAEDAYAYPLTRSLPDVGAVGANDADAYNDIKVTPPSPVSNKSAPLTSSAPAPSSPRGAQDASPNSVFGTTSGLVQSPQPIDIPSSKPRRGSSSAYDYFEGPDLGEDFGSRREGQQRPWKRADKDKTMDAHAVESTPYSYGVATQVGSQSQPRPIERSSRSSTSQTSFVSPRSVPSQSLSPRESRSRSRSKSRTPSPGLSSSPSSQVPTQPSTNPATSSSLSSPTSSLLYPPTTRGRRPIAIHHSIQQSASDSLSPPPSGGAGSYRSYHRGRDADRSSGGGDQQTRGRSSTRTSSSFSDRERSRSTHSLGSPSLGSLSPDGSGILNGGAAGYGYGSSSSRWSRDRERDSDRESERERTKSGGVGGSRGERKRRGGSSGSSSPADREPAAWSGHSQAGSLNNEVIPEERETEDLLDRVEVALSSTPSEVVRPPSTPANSPEATRMLASFGGAALRTQQSGSTSTTPVPSPSPIVPAPAPTKRSSSTSIPSSSATPLPTTSHRSSGSTSKSSIKGSPGPAPIHVSTHARTPSVSSPTLSVPGEFGGVGSTSSSSSLPSTKAASPKATSPKATSSQPTSSKATATSPKASSPTSPTSNQSFQPNGIVGKAVGIVSSAGALLGLWQDHGAGPAGVGNAAGDSGAGVLSH